MQSTGHSSTQALSFTSIQGSAITYAMSSLLRPPPYPRSPWANPAPARPLCPVASITRMSTIPTAASLLNGHTAEDAPGGTLRISNPAHLDEAVVEARLGDATTFLEACREAKAAQPAWAAIPAPTRGRAIQHLGRLVEENFESLSQLITREIGKPIKESRGEVQEVVDTCNFFLGEGRRLYGQTVPSEMSDKQLFTFRVPVGVATIVTAGNFPVAVPSWYLVPALLCGNAVVWKPAEYNAAIGSALPQLL